MSIEGSSRRSFQLGIWTSMEANLPLFDALHILYDCGWRAFEISSEHLVSIETDPCSDGLIEQVAECVEELGLVVPQSHALLGASVARPDAQERENDIRRLMRHIEISAKLGVSNVVMHPAGIRGDVTSEEQVRVRRLNVETFRRLGDYAGEHGARICLENLMCFGASTSSDMLELLDAIDHPLLGITLDTSHANVRKLDIAAAIRDFGKHLIATHISDNNGSGDQHLMPGSGTIDWPQVMTAFRDIGYTGFFNLEIPGERHPDGTLRQINARYALEVAKWLGELAPVTERISSPLAS